MPVLTLQLAPEAVNKSGCKAEFEVVTGLCSTITKLYGNVLASILGPPIFVMVIYGSLKGTHVDFSSSRR